MLILFFQSSATSVTMTTRRPSSGRPVASRRQAPSLSQADVEYEAKAAYLVIVDDINVPLESLVQLRNGEGFGFGGILYLCSDFF